MAQQKYADFIQTELDGVEQALRLAKKALRTTDGLQDFFSPQPDAGEDDFSRDTFKYFDANSALRQLESLQLQLGELKEKLIEVKIANDRMLYAGGYLAVIDDTIARIFLKNRLCKLEAQSEKTPLILEDTLKELTALKEQLLTCR